MKKTIAVLGYHKIGEPPGGWHTWSYVLAKAFKAQLQFLKDNDCRVIEVTTFIQSITEPGISSEGSVLITFDEGYYSNLTVALPVLQKFNYPAVIFVPVHFIGGYNAFDGDIMYEPKEQICSWEQLISLDQQGISVQSHGLTQRHFSRLSIKAQVAEAVQSKALLEDRLNKQVDAFSFPYGDNGTN
ncbi:MAG: polysaccharide deacetylase family protein, partial [Chitinophagaceae bacterium]|nr:polysaccharide deacetylase family protein [Chitinophagaceae bacterium]